MMDSRSRVVTHVARVAFAVLTSATSFAILIALDRTVLSAYPLVWFIWPVAIGAGYIPLWRWYRRDAYPIGLVFAPAMFFLLRYLYQLVDPWFWQK